MHLDLKEENINVGLDDKYFVVEINNMAAVLSGHSQKPLLFGMQENFDFQLTFKEGGINIKLVFEI